MGARRALYASLLLSAGCASLLGIDDHSLAPDPSDASLDAPLDGAGGDTTTTEPDAPDEPSGHDASHRSDATAPDGHASEGGAPETSVPHEDASGADSGADSEADARADTGVADAFVCPPHVDPDTNYLYQQPDPSTWLDNFGGSAHIHMTCDFVPACPALDYSACCPSVDDTCGTPATHWAQTGLPTASWILVYVNNSPLSANLQKGMTYTAQLSVNGTTPPGVLMFLDVWDGATDNASPAQPVSAGTVTTFTKTFTMSSGTNPQIQLRWGLAPGANLTSVDVDLLIWNVAID